MSGIAMQMYNDKTIAAVIFTSCHHYLKKIKK